jgi:lipopolysaccharide/colanic/teichoic acid biosynthesis glycosyltransferase
MPVAANSRRTWGTTGSARARRGAARETAPPPSAASALPSASGAPSSPAAPSSGAPALSGDREAAGAVAPAANGSSAEGSPRLDPAGRSASRVGGVSGPTTLRDVVAATPTTPEVRPLLELLPVEALVDLEGLTARAAPDEPFVHDRPYLLAKRALDIAAAGLALLALSPVLAVIALLVRLEDGGPALFAQTRVGKGGREFRFWKFRSMVVDAEARKASLAAQGPTDAVSDRLRFKMQDDPRVTRVGRVLRRFSLDELPQLWNVVRGDMSLVGPRPPIPSEVAEYEPRHRRRLEVEQGITCLWQVSGRNLLSFEEQVALDVEYARRRGLLLDLSLLVRTVPAVLGGRGAC